MVTEEQLHEIASQKNLTVVGETNVESLREKFQSSKEQIEIYLKKKNPENEPYKFKYKAKEILNQLREENLGHQVISQVQGGLSTEELSELKNRVAYINSHLGILCLKIEEPHNAENFLFDAIEFFLPSFNDYIYQFKLETDEEANKTPTQEIEDMDNALKGLKDVKEIVSKWNQDVYSDVLESLNSMAVLWCNRQHFIRALCYLEVSKRCYDIITGTPEVMPPVPPSSSTNTSKEITEESNEDDPEREQLDLLHTHTLFYLAQVYGHLQNSHQSAIFCYQTLQRQVQQTNFDKKEWISNCSQLAFYYINKGAFIQAAHCLSSCNVVEKQLIEANQNVKSDSERLVSQEEMDELHAILQRRWGHFYLQVLQIACEQKSKENTIINTSNTTKIETFKGLIVPDIPYSNPKEIINFEQAREVFKAGNAAYSVAKEYYVLDGYVTDHIQILEDISALYRHLIQFESDLKRALAMQSRRSNLLQPLVSQLNVEIYQGLLKQLTFELGEIYTAMIDLKDLRLEEKKGSSNSTGISISNTLTNNDIQKFNQIVFQGIKSFYQFICLYSPDSSSRDHLLSITSASTIIKELQKNIIQAPDQLDDDEYGTYLRAHFYISRLYGRMKHCETSKAVEDLRQSLRHYENTKRLANNLMPSSGPEPKDFEIELKICQEMIQLLPEQINRLHFS